MVEATEEAKADILDVDDVNVDLVGRIDYPDFFTVYEDKDKTVWLKLDTEIRDPKKCHLSPKGNVVGFSSGGRGKQIGITNEGDPMVLTVNLLVYTTPQTVGSYGLEKKVVQASTKKDVKSAGFTAR
jgi:hypothetical protein